MVYPDYADKIISRLESHGKSAYIVGGSVRDMLLELTPHDFDITTSALPEQTAQIFSDMRVIATGIKHGTLTVICDSHPVEITTFRIDGSYSDSRHPDAVSFTDDIVADLSRRDFTVNAMAYNASRGLVDPFGGQRDLSDKILRAVGEPRVRFCEDALRIMRAFRFCAQLGFDIEPHTLDACEQERAGLEHIARERIGAETVKLLTSHSPSKSLALMSERGILPYVLGNYHPSKTLMERMGEMPRDDFARLGFLLSDADADTAREILHSLRLSGKQITGSLAVAKGAKICVITPADARRLIANTGIYAYACACASELLGISPKGAADIVLRQQNTPCKLRDLKINGKDVAMMGVSGKRIGQLLEQILRLVVDDPSLNDRETLLALAAQTVKKSEDINGKA